MLVFIFRVSFKRGQRIFQQILFSSR
jgi:hypothetical protein